jgi:hypothetical protein
MFRLTALIRQPAAFRPDHFSPAAAACGRGHGHRDVLDDGEAAFLLRLRDCLIPAVVDLALEISMTPQRINAIKNRKSGPPYFFTNNASEAVKPCR